MDVVTGVNLFFKFILLSPIFLFAIYVSITMMKHMIFQGIPTMNKPTEAQEERLREKDSLIGMPVDKPVEAPVQQQTEQPVVPQKPKVKPQPPVATIRTAPPVMPNIYCCTISYLQEE